MEEILEKIVELDGNCFDRGLCRRCPFKRVCLKTSGGKLGLARSERLHIALDAMARLELLEDEL